MTVDWKLCQSEEVFIDLSIDPEITDFLNHQKKSTRNTYSAYMRRLKEFTTETGREILANPKLWKRKIFEFQQWLLERDYSECYAQSATGMIRGFFAYNEIPFMFTRGDSKRLAERNRKTEDYLFDKEDLSKMAMVGNLKDRYILLVGKSVGLRAGDFVNFTYGKFRGLKLDLDAPVFIGTTVTQKERVPAYPFLDSDALPIIKTILEANQDKPNNEYILMTRSKKLHNTFQKMQDSELSYILQSLAKKAKIQNGSKRIRFHCLRKYLSDRLSSTMSESKWKQIVGKKISEGAYINADSLREDFSKAMPNIAISTNGSNGKVIELEKRVDDLKGLVEFYRKESERSEEDVIGGTATHFINRIDALEKKLAKLEGKKIG